MTTALAGSASITGIYRARFYAVRTAMQAAVDSLWRSLYDPANPMESLASLGDTVGTWTVGGQLTAATDATNYLQQLWSNASRQPVIESAPFIVPEGLVGSAATGGSVAALTRIAPRVFLERLEATESLQLAEATARAFLERVSVSEPNRAGNQTIIYNAREDERLTGRYNRITSRDACAFCLLIAERGYIEWNAGFDAHNDCRCNPEPEINTHAFSSRALGRAALAQRAAAGDIAAQEEQERVAIESRRRAQESRQRRRGFNLQ